MITQAVREGWRSLRTRPALTMAAVLSLALGMGGITALFSLLNAAVLRPLPVRDPHALVAVATERSDSFPDAVWAEIRDRQLLPDAFAWVFTTFDTAAGGEQQPVDGLMVSGNTFAVLGVDAALGRLIEPADDRAGGGRDGSVAVISHAFWQRRFGANAGVIGRTLMLDRQAFTIIGVTDRSFTGLYGGLGFDVAIALDVVPQRFYRTVMGRARPGDTPETLTAVLQAAQPSIRTATVPPTMAEPYRTEYLGEPMVVRPAPGGVSFLARRYTYPLQVLLATSTLLLLLACGNIAMLQTARGQERRRELSIRTALGASGRRLALLCLVESAFIATAGLVIGLWMARVAIGLILSHLSTQAFAVVLNVDPDWRVAVFAFVLVGLTTLLFGALPAWQAGRSDAIDALRSRRATLGVSRLGLGVIAGQAAASVVLLASAALLARSFMNLASVPTGFEADRVLVVEIEGPAPSDTLETRLLDAVESAPGIEAAGVSNSVPAGNSATTPWLELEDGTKLPSGIVDGVFSHQVTPGWLATYGTRVVAGRGLTFQDRPGSPRVALVNRRFVERLLDGRSPLGLVVTEREHPDGPGHAVEIVGVVEDAMYRMLREDIPPTIYTALAQHTGVRFPTLQLSIRPRHRPDAAVRQQLASVIAATDRDLSFRMRTLDDQVGAQMRRERLLAVVSSGFAVLGLLLGAVGLYGIVSWTVARRRFELGVRAALGAPQHALVDVVARPTAVALAVGLGAGVAGTSTAAGLLQGLLFGVEPGDAVSLALPCVTLVTVGLAAVLRPLRSAVRIDPSVALRTE